VGSPSYAGSASVSEKRQRQQARRRARKAKARTAVPAYLPAVLQLAQAAGPGLHHVTVRHDDDCPMLSGGACTCAPVVEYGAPNGRCTH
jgi:hypothetical protein